MTHELYKVHRPTTFKAVVGQEETCKILLKKVMEGKVPHCILLSGPSGCGKTTIARILAKKLGCKQSANFYESNAASARGIEDVRMIERRYNMAPVGGDACRVWLIDECHQLTKEAQSAFLKMTEDTPAHVYFIFCTTDPNKLLPTLQNRGSHFKIKAITPKKMEELLLHILAEEGRAVSEDVLDKLVNAAEGSARKALVLLDQVLNLEEEEEQLEAIQNSDTQRVGYELFKLLCNPRVKWNEVAAFLKQTEEEPEGLRRLVLAIASKVVLGGGQNSDRCYNMIQSFRDNYFDVGKAGLIASCYEVVKQL